MKESQGITESIYVPEFGERIVLTATELSSGPNKESQFVDVHTLAEQLTLEFQTEIKAKGTESTIAIITHRIAAEVERVCQKSGRIQAFGQAKSWQISLALARHRLQKCINYYQLGSQRGRTELHSTLGSMVYRYVAPSRMQLGFQARYTLIEDFLQGFYSESLKAFRRENVLPETYQPRRRLELAEYMAFTEQYAKRRISLPAGQNQQLIVLRSQRFGQRQPLEVSVDIEALESARGEEAEMHNRMPIVQQLRERMVSDTVDSSEAVLRDRVIYELVQYLESEGQTDCVDYLVLKLQDMSPSEIDDALRLTPRQRDYLQERFKYHVENFTLSRNWKLVHQWLGADLDQNLGMATAQWDSFLARLTSEQRQMLQLKQAQTDDAEIASKLKLTAKQFQKRWGNLLEIARQIRNQSGELELNIETKVLLPKQRLGEQELPLVDLFTRLKEAGLSLGIDEYFLVLRALQKGFGTADQQALAELCRTLWVKSKDEEHLFNYHFEQVMQTIPLPPDFASIAAEQESTSPSLPALNVRQEMQNEDPKAEEMSAPSPGISQELMEVEEEIQVAEAVQIATRLEGDVIINRFTESDEYFPVTRRQMKQSWRHLRRMVREGPLVEIDIEATITCFSQQGIPSDPVLVPGRINRTKLLLLLDHKGSMVPFHALSQRLAETAQRGGRLGEAGVFYFHNCPTQYLYRDPSRQQAELVSNLLMKLRPDRSVVLIFSDGGAARGGFNLERLELTNQFLDRLKERVRYITWLNPIAKERWAGTTAGEIAQRVPMFEMSRRGMEGAIDVLRGRSLQVVG